MHDFEILCLTPDFEMLRLAEDFEMLRLMPDFEILRLTCDCSLPASMKEQPWWEVGHRKHMILKWCV